jgi:plastocyanin
MPPLRSLILFSWVLASTAQAGDVRGKLPVKAKADADLALVYLANVPEEAFRVAPAATARMSQKGARFTPQLLAIVKGTSVDLTNDDWTEHSAYSMSLTKVFDLGIYSNEERRVVVFDKVGVVELGCFIHPDMNAVILVLQNPFFTKPGADGSFSLKGVPAGTYKLRVFRKGEPEREIDVKVPMRGVTAVEL